MACDETRRLGAYLDEELPPAERETVAKHLEGCLLCQAELVALRQLRERLSALPRVKAPAALAAAVAGKVAALPVKHPEAGLSGFIDDELSGEERQLVGDHIAACPPCAQEVVALDDVVGRVRTLPRKSAPAELLPRVIEQLWSPGRRRRAEDRPFDLGPNVKRFLAAASFFVLAVGSAAFSTPNTSAHSIPGVREASVALMPPPPPTVLNKETKKKPPEALVLLVQDLATGAQNLAKLGEEAGFTMASDGFNEPYYALRGQVAALREVAVAGAACGVQLEDSARFDEAVPVPTDKVIVRTGEHLDGWCEREDATTVVFSTTARSAQLPDVDAIGTGAGLQAEHFELPSTPPDVATAFRNLTTASLVTFEPTVDLATPGALAGARAFRLKTRTVNFAVRFRGYFAAHMAGAYNFSVGSDDGALLELDHQTICGADGNHGYAESAATVSLARGFHALTILYFNGGGAGAVRLQVAEPGKPLAIAPRELLYEPGRVERGVRVVSVTLPKRSIVRLDHPSPQLVTIHVLLRKRQE
jgi:anti-sigma factor RsiW